MDVMINGRIANHRLVGRRTASTARAMRAEMVRRGITNYDLMDIGTGLACYWYSK